MPLEIQEARLRRYKSRRLVNPLDGQESERRLG